MAKATFFAVLIMLVAAMRCMHSSAQGEPARVEASLVRFLHALAGDDGGGDQAARALGWNASLDSCGGGGVGTPWHGVLCDSSRRVTRIDLAGLRGSLGLDLNGTVDAAPLCAAAPALRVLNLRGNGLRGALPAGIAGCTGLVTLLLGDNRLSGALPASLSQLGNLRALDVSRNSFSGVLPAGLGDLDKLLAFRAHDNRFRGGIPDFDLTRFVAFNVSSNSLTGPIPGRTGRFGADSFLPNAPGLCGQLLFAPCHVSPAPQPSYSVGN